MPPKRCVFNDEGRGISGWGDSLFSIYFVLLRKYISFIFVGKIYYKNQLLNVSLKPLIFK